MSDDTLSESFQNFIGPINTGTGSSRPGGDSINISYTKGKKSLDDQLKEIALAKAALDLESQSEMPADYQKQQFDWSAQQAADTKSANERAAAADAQTLALKAAEEGRQQQSAQIAAQTAAYQQQAAAYEQSQQGLKTATAKQALAASQQQQSLAAAQAQRDAQAQGFAYSKADADFRNEHLGMSPNEYTAWYAKGQQVANNYQKYLGGYQDPGGLDKAYANIIKGQTYSTPGGGSAYRNVEYYGGTPYYSQDSGTGFAGKQAGISQQQYAATQHDRQLAIEQAQRQHRTYDVDAWGNVKTY